MSRPASSPEQKQFCLNALNGGAIFLISSAVIIFQIGLMRSLSVTKYHHFSYLVISIALLGFGASGTFLTFAAPPIRKNFPFWSGLFIFFFFASIPSSYELAEKIPLDIQYLLYSGKQVLLLVYYTLLLFIPFFFAGAIIGISLVHFRENVPFVYGLNLFGSGAGGICSLIALSHIQPFDLPKAVAAVAFLALLFWFASFKGYFRGRLLSLTALFFVSGSVLLFFFLSRGTEVMIDQYKAISHFDRLALQSGAKRLVTKYGPRGRIDAYESDQLHQTLFAGLQADVLPPKQLALLIDGEQAGTIFRIKDLNEAAILDFTPQSLAYRMIDRPRVLLLGEVGGVNVWLAKRFGASRITVVQGNRQLNDLLRNELADLSGKVFVTQETEVVTQEPHVFAGRTEEKFDIVHIVTAEGFAVTAGLQSLHEDYLLTRETIAKCISILSDRGMITLTRGIQSPPRDSLKVFGLFVSALEDAGVKDPRQHLLVARNYLAANTMLAKQPLGNTVIGRFRGLADELLMDTEYFPGIESREIYQINRMEGPDRAGYSFLHYGIMKILSSGRQDFFREWAYRIDPPTDNNPYFLDFFSWRSLGRFIDAYRGQWLQRLEFGYVVLTITLLTASLLALLLILVPLFRLRAGEGGKPMKLVTGLYFLCLGFGFMFIEMVSIQKMTRYLGDPVSAASAAITAILVFSGIGSLWQKKMRILPLRRISYGAAGIVVLAVSAAFFLDRLLDIVSGYDILIRFSFASLSLAPLAFFMGWMFPSGLMILEKGPQGLIPWAWGVNGFTSVMAAPLSVMLAMSYGFTSVTLAAVLCYGTAVFAAIRMDKALG
jgi:hypothetical protein